MEREVKASIGDVIHEFYCDECNSPLGSSYECDDGYYEERGVTELKIRVNDSWYTMHKNFCTRCKAKKLQEFTKDLEKYGFEKERY